MEESGTGYKGNRLGRIKLKSGPSDKSWFEIGKQRMEEERD